MDHEYSARRLSLARVRSAAARSSGADLVMERVAG